MADIVEIDCSNLDITSLQGIEYAVNLQKLNCSQNKITDIDLSYNKNLEIIIWNKNPFLLYQFRRYFTPINILRILE